MNRRWSAALVLVMAGVAGLAGTAEAQPSEESAFLALINSSRAAAGMPALAEHWDLIDDARRHTSDMMATGGIFHSSTDQLTAVTTSWSLIGENVGRGPDPDRLHEAFMSSSTHRANVLGDYAFVGVGAEHSADGILFVTVLFMQPPTATVAGPTTTTTPRATLASAAALPPLFAPALPAAPPQPDPRPAPLPPPPRAMGRWVISHWALGDLCLSGAIPACAD